MYSEEAASKKASQPTSLWTGDKDGAGDDSTLGQFEAPFAGRATSEKRNRLNTGAKPPRSEGARGM